MVSNFTLQPRFKKLPPSETKGFSPYITEFPSFERLNSTPLYVYITFFVHSSVNGRIACSHILATVNSATMNTVVLVFLQDSHFNSCDKYPEVGLLDHTVVLFLVFAAPWMKLKDIVPSEISQSQKDTYGMTSPV